MGKVLFIVVVALLVVAALCVAGWIAASMMGDDER